MASINSLPPTDRRDSAAYGGAGWSPRRSSLSEELGSIWAQCGVNSEWQTLRAVLLHRPGRELATSTDPNAMQMMDAPDPVAAAAQHDTLADRYREHGVHVHLVEPAQRPPPNMMFVADLMFMTPAGAIIARPASTVRAGEERWVGRRIADMGVPILRSIGGRGVFEGADAMWLDPHTVVISVGLRTNAEGAAQVATTLREQNIDALIVDSPVGTMHLMGQFRIVDRDLALVAHGRFPWRGLEALRERGYRVLFFPDDDEVARGAAANFVPLGPRRIVMPAGNPVSQRFYEEHGIACITVEIGELLKAAGAIGCLSGIVARDLTG